MGVLGADSKSGCQKNKWLKEFIESCAQITTIIKGPIRPFKIKENLYFDK